MSTAKKTFVAKPPVKRGRVTEKPPTIAGTYEALVAKAKTAGAMLQPGEAWHDTPPQKLYKFLRANGRTPQQNFPWPLPKDGKPGAWLEVKGELRTCRNGLHLTDETHARDWVSERVYEVEVEGGVLASSQKYVARKVRLVREVPGWREALAEAKKTKVVSNDSYRMPPKATTTMTDWDRYQPLLLKVIKERLGSAELIDAVKTATTADEALGAVTKLRDGLVEAGRKARIDNLEAELKHLRGPRRGKVKPKSKPVPRPDGLVSFILRSAIKPTVEHYAILKAGGSFAKSWYSGFEWRAGPYVTVNDTARAELKRLEPPKPKDPEPKKKAAPKLPSGLLIAAQSFAPYR